MTTWFAPVSMRATMHSRRAESDEGPLRCNAGSAGRAVRNAAAIAAIVLAAYGVSHAQTVAATTQTAPAPPEQPASRPAIAPASNGLSDLSAMTFSCPTAGLNAAAREAAKVPSQGTYQFSYFRIINDAHHASYEIHFKSNYEGEADLKYCVSMYCQQGWDPTRTNASVMPLGTDRRRGGGAAHAATCTPPPERLPVTAEAGDIPGSTPVSDALSKDLKARGIPGFVGSTIVYAFMQSVGLVDDHPSGCFRYGVTR